MRSASARTGTPAPTSRPPSSRWTRCSPSGPRAAVRGPAPDRPGALRVVHERYVRLGMEARRRRRGGVGCGAGPVPASGERADRNPEPAAKSGLLSAPRATTLSAGEPAARRLPVNWHMPPLQRQVPGRGFSRAGSARAFVVTGLLAIATVACSHPLAAPSGGNPPPDRPTLTQTYRPSGHMAAGDVFVHLFEWKWTDIATECEQVLGPAGFAAVQVSPPEEHSITPNHDWSERYQPVSYSIARSRSGDSLAFVDMVQRCAAKGVGVIVDAVINHMTNYPSPGVGSNGTAYTKYDYPGLYAPGDFHTPCVVNNYQDAANVQDCELFSLPDLNTGIASVRQKIADYLLMLARLGVAGFRIDAAKHIQQVELDDIQIGRASCRERV